MSARSRTSDTNSARNKAGRTSGVSGDPTVKTFWRNPRAESSGQKSKPVKADHSAIKTKSGRHRTTPSAGSGKAPDEFEDQEIKFINVKRPRSGSSSSRSKHKGAVDSGTDSRAGSVASLGGFEDEDEGRDIAYKEILEQSQETEPGKVYEVDLHAEGIGRISNIDKFVKLRVLDLSSNFINKIDCLHANTDLRELKLYDNRISVLENLNNCEQLSHLQLQHNRIKSIGRNLKYLKKLKILRIDCNRLIKLDPGELAPCMMITTLDISHNKLENIAALNSLPNLEELHAAGNILRAVTDLGRCKKLQEVDLSSNRLTDVSGLKGMVHLTVLNLSHNNIITLNTLGKLKSLQTLYLSHNRVSSVKSLAALFPNLELLNIAENKIDSWDAMRHLSAFSLLAELYVSGNPVCLEDGEKPHYHTDIQTLLPELDVLDGALLKRPSARGPAPLMRPMSANSVISARQVESQMNALAVDMHSFETNISEKFDSLRATFKFLPEEAPSSARDKLTTASGRPSSRCSNRSRLQEAKTFAEQHF